MARGHLDFNLQLLNFQQSFFPRVDGKGLALFTIAGGMLSIIALNFPYSDFFSARGWAGALAAAFDALALWHLAWVFIPRLSGASKASLIFFNEIASMEQSQYVATLRACTDDQLAEDAAHQVWRNAEILQQKYRDLNKATVRTALAVLPWTAFLISTAIEGGSIAVSK